MSSSWLCPACTFENIKSVVACAMCNTKGPRWACPQCTLENPLTVSFCNVCGGKAPPPPAPKPVAPKTKAQQEEEARLQRMMVSGIQFQMGMTALKDGSDEDSEAEPDSDEEIRMPKKVTAEEAKAAGKAPPPPGGKSAKDGSDEDSEAESSSEDSTFEEPQAQPHTPSPAAQSRKLGEGEKPKPAGPPGPPGGPPSATGPDGQVTGELAAKSRSGKVRKPRKPKLDKDGNPIPKKPKKSKLLKKRRARQAGARAKAAEERLAAEEAALAQQLTALFEKPEAAADGKAAEAAKPAAEAKKEPPKPIQPLTFVFFGNSGCGKSFLIDELKENQKLFFKGLSSTAISRSRTNFNECDGMLDTEGRTGEFLEQITLKCQAPRTIPVLVVDHAYKFTETFNACLAGLSLALNLIANDYVLVINKIISNKKVAAPEEAKQLKEKFIHISTQIGRAPTRTCLVRFNADFTQENIAGRYLPLQAATSFETLVTSTTDEERKINFIAAQLVINDELSVNRSKNLDKFWPSTAVDEKWSGIPEEIRSAWTDADPPMAGFDKSPYNKIPVPPVVAKLTAEMADLAPKIERRRVANAAAREQEARVLMARLQLLHGNSTEANRLASPKSPKPPPPKA